MKKALVILMALSMVFAAFADEPAVKNEIAEFKGDATVTWGVDLDNSTTGFRNVENGSLKFTLINDGTKATTGDGVWGEIAVSINNDDGVQYTNGSWNGKTVGVDKAKLHITDMIAIGIRKGNVTNGGYKLALAADSDQDTLFNVGAFGGSAATTQGITLEIALPDLLNLNIDFRSEDIDNPANTKADYTNNYGIAADVDVKAVDNLTLKVGYGMDFYGTKTKGLFAQFGYKAALDDKFFLEPQVAFGTNLDTSMKLAAGVLFGWGDKNKDPIKFMNTKVSNGFSVATIMDFKDMSTIPLCVAVYDSTFVENLCAGVEFHVDNLKATGLPFVLAFDAKYDLGDIVPTFGLEFGKAATANTLKIYAACDYKAIANTTFTLGYESGDLIASNIGQLWVSAKISF